MKKTIKNVTSIAFAIGVAVSTRNYIYAILTGIAVYTLFTLKE